MKLILSLLVCVLLVGCGKKAAPAIPSALHVHHAWR